MSDYVTLLGAEDVQRAGSRMVQAAERMEQAAAQIEHALDRYAERIEIALARAQSDESDQ